MQGEILIMEKEVRIMQDLENDAKVGEYRGVRFKIYNDVFKHYENNKDAIYRVMQEVLIAYACIEEILDITYDQISCSWVSHRAYVMRLHDGPAEQIPKINYI